MCQRCAIQAGGANIHETQPDANKHDHGTPSVTPSETPSLTPSSTTTPLTNTPTDTPSITPTATLSPTLTPTLTPTGRPEIGFIEKEELPCRVTAVRGQRVAAMLAPHRDTVLYTAWPDLYDVTGQTLVGPII